MKVFCRKSFIFKYNSGSTNALSYFKKYIDKQKFDSWKSLIASETKIIDNHLTPELKLHLITSDVRLWYSKNYQPFLSDPFWAFYWPGGQALSRYILDNRKLFENQEIIDFGCGCGASGISALKSNATSVIFNDIDEVALAAVHKNVEVNNINSKNFYTCSENLIGNLDLSVKYIFVGDMLYESELAAEIQEWLTVLAKRDTKILIGDPGRISVEKILPVEKLATYKLLPNTILENCGFTEASVFTVLKTD